MPLGWNHLTIQSISPEVSLPMISLHKASSMLASWSFAPRQRIVDGRVLKHPLRATHAHRESVRGSRCQNSVHMGARYGNGLASCLKNYRGPKSVHSCG